MEFSREQIESLINKYPYLIPRNAFTGKVSPSYDFSYVKGSDMSGWFKLVLLFCKNARPILDKEYAVDKFWLIEIKEKWGMMEMYTNHPTKGEDLEDLICIYRRLSRYTCHTCGQPAKWKSCHWVEPWCDACMVKQGEDCQEEFISLNKMQHKIKIERTIPNNEGKTDTIRRNVRIRKYWKEYLKCKDMSWNEFYEYLMK